jgi:hypothetical protein
MVDHNATINVWHANRFDIHDILMGPIALSQPIYHIHHIMYVIT